MQIEDDDEMAIRVRHFSENEIERDAEFMLAEFEETAGEPVRLPPLPPTAASTVLGHRDLTPFF